MIRPAVGYWLIGAVALTGAGMAALPTPAQADSFAFSYSSGYYGHRNRPPYGHHRHYNHRHYHHNYYSYRSYWGPPTYYAPPPRVVVVEPPAYYAPPPVIYAPQGQLSAVPASPVYQAPNGQYCREYQSGVTVSGRVQPSYGTACLMPDGAWRVVN